MLELAGIIVLGIFAQWLAWRIKVPAILPLILIGLLVGPLSTLKTADGSKWIEPIHDGVKGLFPGDSLFYFVSLAIGIILFEGGLTLKRSEIKGVGPAIFKLITLGSAVTFIGAGLAAKFILGIPWTIAFLFSALIIVTGPTVIAPILRNIPLNKNVATVLKWEGILIDPIGALVAVLVFEFILTSEGGHFTQHALMQFSKIVVVGFALGFTAAHLLYQFIKRDWVPHYLLNVFTLALVLAVFVGSDMVAHESGLLTVVVMGMVLGNMDVPMLKEILDFKETLSILLISILFILLSANIDIAELNMIMKPKYFILLFVVIFVIRPIAVFMSTKNSELSVKEKVFISWVGPRGIVAAGIASLFGIKLTAQGIPFAEIITPLVFLIVLGTVLLNATTAKLVAGFLDVILKKSNGILIVGAHKAARLIGNYLKDNGRHVVLIDSNYSNVNDAKSMGLISFQANVYSDELGDNLELTDVGYLMALTSSTDINTYVCNRFANDFGENGTFRLVSADEMQDPTNNPTSGLFSHTDDYINFSEVARDYPTIRELPISSIEEYKIIISMFEDTEKSIPVFIKNKEGVIRIISSFAGSMEVNPEDTLVYLGKELEIEKKVEEE